MTETEMIELAAEARKIAAARGAGRRYHEDLVSESVLAALLDGSTRNCRNAIRKVERSEWAWEDRHADVEHSEDAYGELARKKALAPLRLRLYEALKALSPRHYLVISLEFHGGLALVDIAERMGITPSAVFQMRGRAIARLKIFLGETLKKPSPDCGSSVRGGMGTDPSARAAQTREY